jgi:hypothetical protein
MLALLEHSPDLYLDEIQEQLIDQHDMDISLSTLWRTLKRLGISSKSVSTARIYFQTLCPLILQQLSEAAAERCEESRRAFAMEIGMEPAENIVCADECAVNILTTYRNNGWAYTGVRARQQCNFVRGTRYNCLSPLMRLSSSDTILLAIPCYRQ